MHVFSIAVCFYAFSRYSTVGLHELDHQKSQLKPKASATQGLFLCFVDTNKKKISLHQSLKIKIWTVKDQNTPWHRKTSTLLKSSNVLFENTS